MRNEPPVRQQYNSSGKAEQVFGKTLPANIEAERSVLGALLLNDEYFPVVSDWLRSDDFYTPAHKIIYQAMLEVIKQTRRIDLVTLQDELTKRGCCLSYFIARRYSSGWSYRTTCPYSQRESDSSGIN